MEHVTIPLERAYLCVNCNHIGANGRQCPNCAGRSLLMLQRILDRKPFQPLTSMSHMIEVLDEVNDSLQDRID